MVAGVRAVAVHAAAVHVTAAHAAAVRAVVEGEVHAVHRLKLTMNQLLS